MADSGELNQVLDLETIELDMFRGRTPDRGGPRIFGGQVVAQALAAAYRTVEGRICHSLHSYFIRAGDPSIPILYKVERARDGASFTTRRVTAIQHGRQIFNLSASFQVPEAGFEHQSTMPGAPDPGGLLNDEQLRALEPEPGDEARKPWPVEMRPIDPGPRRQIEPREPTFRCWFRAREDVGDDVATNQCVLAYASDMSLMDSSVRPHVIDWNDPKFQGASLDHALWFHRPCRFSEWHLYVQDSPSASGARGFNRGEIYSRDGVLVASATQEALIRYRS
ncbi:acyl-CoA thioesterase [Phenylobacterium montanum]|uniref:Acyl-CoA thioesterase 2 n=1 Tax=Phenylobacterium montanum TaxID=2823693 RepID=A0A975G193_9CAUL|nr:acyl-CoA thioesterase II [Caulobacter sp. S6]QUD88896.1 acyl-CoA thioesterase II [Caulobacter sp. S6]